MARAKSSKNTETIRRYIRDLILLVGNLRGTPSPPSSQAPVDVQRASAETATLRHILSKRGTQIWKEVGPSNICMQRYLQFVSSFPVAGTELNLMQYMLQELTLEEIQNLLSLVEYANEP